MTCSTPIGYCVWLFIFLCGLVGDSVAAEASAESRVLVVSSYSPIREGGNHIIASFVENLTDRIHTHVVVEYMDSESSPEFASWCGWMTQLFRAYKAPPSAVVLLGGEAWSVYRFTCPEAWRQVPVVLGCVKGGYIDYENAPHVHPHTVSDMPPMESSFGDFRVTGYFFQDYLEENLLFIKRLQPQVTKVAFVYDNRYSFDFIRDYLHQTFARVDGIDLCNLNGDKFSTLQVLDTIAQMDNSYALLSAGWYTDVNRYSHAYAMIQSELGRYTSKCVYQLVDEDLSKMNYFGGYFISGKDLGADLSGLAYEVLTKGIEHSPAFSQTPSRPKYYVNYPLFERSGIDKRLLPADTVFYNTEPSLFEEHPLEVVLTLLSVFLILLLFTVLLRYRKRREQYYKTTNKWMMQLLESMPDMAVIYDADLKIREVVNPRSNVMLGFQREDLMGLALDDLGKKNPSFRTSVGLIAENVRRTAKSKEVCCFNYEVDYEDKIYYSQSWAMPFGKNDVICFIRDVTAQVTAEKEVLKLQKFLQSIVDNLPVGLFVKDATDDYRYIFYNDRMADFYGDDYGYQLGKNDYETNDPEADLYRREDEQVIRSESPLSFERVIYKHGEACRWGITTKKRLINDDGTCYVIAIITETTAIRQKEFELENIRRELLIALEAGSMSAWIYDVQRKWFSSLYKQTVSDDGMTLQTGASMLHPDDLEKYYRFMEELSSGCVEKKREIFRFMRGGAYGFYETYSIAIRSERTGQVVQIIGTEKNITEDVARERELKESKSKLELAFRSADISPWEYNVDTEVFSSLNPGVFENKGILLDEYMGYVAVEDRQWMAEELNALIRGMTSSLNIQIRAVFPGKPQRWYEMHGVVSERDGEGRVLRIIGLRRDITALKMTDELIELRNKAEEANRLKSAFLANMSHEIRTPLNAIVGFSTLIGETDEPDEIKEYIKIIQTNNELLLQLINDILDLSKIEAGQMDFHYSDFEVASIFLHLEQTYRGRTKEGVRLLVELPAEGRVIHSEKNRLTQVVSNFLSNACKFTDEGTIRMGYTSIEGGGLRFYVKDTGKGIAAEHQPEVFKRFAKFDSFVQGTGLGLSISQSIIQYLNGEIGVDSELGKGSEFWFTLPCDPIAGD